MAENGAATPAAAAAIARIADEPVSMAERAQRILQVLGEVIHCDAVSVAARDPERRIRRPLASAGDVAALHAYWTSPEGDPELDRLGLNTPGPPLLGTELPVPAADTVYWSRFLEPARFGGALDAGLFTPDGRHVGHLTALTTSADRPTAADRAALDGLTRPIAHAIDRMRTIRIFAGIVSDAIAGVALTRGGSTEPLPGLPTHRVLAADSPAVAEAADRLTAGDAYAAFLHPAPDTGTLLRISVLDCADEAADHLRAAVLVSPEPDVRGLSPQDLQVLGLLIEGWEDERIAATLGTTVQDVAGTLRRGMHLLGALSRTGLAVRALREGLFLPRRVSGEAE